MDTPGIVATLKGLSQVERDRVRDLLATIEDIGDPSHQDEIKTELMEAVGERAQNAVSAPHFFLTLNRLEYRCRSLVAVKTEEFRLFLKTDLAASRQDQDRIDAVVNLLCGATDGDMGARQTVTRFAVGLWRDKVQRIEFEFAHATAAASLFCLTLLAAVSVMNVGSFFNDLAVHLRGASTGQLVPLVQNAWLETAIRAVCNIASYQEPRMALFGGVGALVGMWILHSPILLVAELYRTSVARIMIARFFVGGWCGYVASLLLVPISEGLIKQSAQLLVTCGGAFAAGFWHEKFFDTAVNAIVKKTGLPV